MTATPLASLSPRQTSLLFQTPRLADLLRLTLPMTGLMLCHLGISLTDLWVAGQIDTAILASLGVVSQLFTIMLIVTSIAGGGTMAAISQSLGAAKNLRARRYAGLVLRMALISGVLISAIVFCLSYYALPYLPVQQKYRPIIQTFIQAYCVQLPCSYCFVLINSIFRAHALVWLPFISSSVLLVTNFFSSIGFGLGWWGMPAYGYAGIAWSTVGSTAVALIINLCFIVSKNILRKDSFAPWRWNKKALPYIARVGVPPALAQLASQGAHMLILTLISSLPGGVVYILAGYTLGIRATSILLFPLAALSLSISIISGHLTGAGKTGTLYSFGLHTAFKTLLFFCLPAFMVWFCRFELALFFTSDSQTVAKAALYIQYACIGLPFSAFTTVISGIYSGAGATYLSSSIQVCSVWGIHIPLAWLLGYACGLGEQGIFMAMPVSTVSSAIWGLCVYKKQKWLECGLKRTYANKGKGSGKSISAGAGREKIALRQSTPPQR